MPIDTKRSTALRILAATGMWRSTYAPPLLRLLWFCGLDIRPPHFAPFQVNALVYGAMFAMVFGSARRIIEGADTARSARAVGIELVLAGALFGLVMAISFERGKRKYRLPAWRDL